MLGQYKFVESSPTASTTVASSNAVLGNPNEDPAVAGMATSLDRYDSLFIELKAVNPSGGTLDIYIQTLAEDVWVDYAHFAQIATGATLNVAFTVSKHVQSASFVATGESPLSGTPTPVLAANTLIGGAWGEALRLVMKTGTAAVAGTNNVVMRINAMTGSSKF